MCRPIGSVVARLFAASFLVLARAHVVRGLAACLLATIAVAQAVPEALPNLEAPTDIRAALFAMEVQ